tara:strand:- start:300 stop:1010 length:711 start_codon:yes stop_codon:yes gene_type:complete
MIFVIGNGSSRKNINLNILKQHGKVIGCNALYRDFTPDHLFTNDCEVLHEIISSQYTNTNETYILQGEIQFLPEELYHDIKMGLENLIENEKNDSVEFIVHGTENKTFLSWIPKNNKIKFTTWSDNNKMYNTGYNACRLACELYSNDEIYMIGFDIFGDRNNLYDNTNGYYSPDTPHHEEQGWIYLFNQLPSIYPNINIRRVIDYGPELENIQSITYEKLCQHSQINQKTLITSTQ